MADANVTIGADATAFNRTLQEISKNTDTMANSISAKLARLGGAFGAISGLCGGVKAVVGGIVDTAKALVEPAAAAERVGLSFEVLLGGEAAALGFFDNLNKYASETPFAFDEVTESAKSLLATTDMSAGEVVMMLKTIGNIAAISGRSMRDVARAYAKACNVGVTNEVAESFETMGIAVRKTIADMRGLTFEEVKRKISGGLIGIKQLNGALELLTTQGGKFDGATQKLSETFEGKMSTLADNWEAIRRAFGEGLLPYVKEMAGKLTEGLQEMMPAVEQLGDMCGAWLGEKLEAGVIPAMDDVIDRMPELWEGMRYVAESTQEWVDKLLKIPNLLGRIWDVGMQQMGQVITYAMTDATWDEAGGFATGVRRAGTAENNHRGRLQQLEEERSAYIELSAARKKAREDRAAANDAARQEERAAKAVAAEELRAAKAKEAAQEEADKKAAADAKKRAEDNVAAAQKYAEDKARYELAAQKKVYDKLSIEEQKRELKKRAAELGVKGTAGAAGIRARMDAVAAQGAAANAKELEALQRLLESWDALIERKGQYAENRQNNVDTLRADALEAMGRGKQAQELRQRMSLEQRIAELRSQGAGKAEAKLQATMESKVAQLRDLHESVRARRVEWIQGNLAGVGGGGASVRLGGATLAEARRQSSLLKEIKSGINSLVHKKSSSIAVLG